MLRAIATGNTGQRRARQNQPHRSADGVAANAKSGRRSSQLLGW